MIRPGAKRDRPGRRIAMGGDRGMADDDPAVGAVDAPAEAASRGSRNPQVFVLERELAEVHLLLDNVSANPATTVSERTTQVGGDGELPEDWLERICDITWPPHGTDIERAEDAALLIRAKDHLNRLSYPASGFTIAFTTLVTQCNLRRELPGAALLRELANREDPDDKAAAEAAAAAAAGTSSPTRRSLAEIAYPDLMIKARLFGRWMRAISWVLLFTLVVSCLLSWYVAYGNAQLAELKSVNAALADIDEAIANEEIGKGKAAAPDRSAQAATAAHGTAAPGTAAAGGAGGSANAGAGASSATGAGEATPKLEPFTHFCLRVPYSDAVQAQTCAARAEKLGEQKRVKRRLRQWTSWPFDPFPGPSAADNAAAPAAPAAGNRAAPTAPAAASELEPNPPVDSDEYQIRDAPAQASLRANIIGSAVLPFLYGLLGAAAAVIRSISKKIRGSLLSPRDLTLSLQQLALGAVTGACIGLFIAGPGKAGGGQTLFDPVGLSAPAISFIAGFGVEAVFQALEELIKRIFNVNPAAAGVPPPLPARPVVVRRGSAASGRDGDADAPGSKRPDRGSVSVPAPPVASGPEESPPSDR
jgi:hypothetical protein